MKQRQLRYYRLLIAGITALAGIVLGLLALLFKLAQRHGEVLLDLEEQGVPGREQAERAPMPDAPPSPRQLLFEQGMPAGSVGMNFELPDLSGENRTLTQFTGRRTLLIFVSPTCEHSLLLLPTLARLPADPPAGQPSIVLISTGDRELNRQVMAQNGIQVPVLLQERDEVAEIYYVNGSPMAYLLDADGVTEIGRIDGPQAILGVAFAAISGQEAPRADMVTISESEAENAGTPLQRGAPLPDFEVPLLDGTVRTTQQLRGHRSLLVLFDPTCEPCIDLLPDLAAIHNDPAQPDVFMISRRDPGSTRAIAEQHEMLYPIGLQRHWDVSRQLGTLAVPSACLVGPGGYLESEMAVGQQAVFGLLKQLRQSQRDRHLVSLASLLREQEGAR